MTTTGPEDEPRRSSAASGDRPGRIRRVRAAIVAAAAAARGHVDAVRIDLDHRRPDRPVLDVLWRAVERDREVNGGVLAAAVAFRLFLFMVPFAFFLVTGLGLAADAAQQEPADLAREAGITGLVASAVRNAGELTVLNRIVVLVGGLYASVRAARSALRVLEAVHSVVWEERPAPLRGVRPVASFVGLGVAIMAVTSVGARLRAVGPSVGVAATVLAGAVPFVVWCWASARLPHAEAPRWALLPGAVLMAVGVQTVHLVTVYWVSRQVANKSQTYGALGLAMAVLLWAYIVGRLVVATTVVNATIWRRHHPAPDGAASEQATAGEEPLHRWPALLRDALRR